MPNEDIAYERDDSQSFASCSFMELDAVSIEALRHLASNPVILRISRSLGHVRRYRKTPSVSMVGAANGSNAVIIDDNFGAPTLEVNSDDPYAVIPMHPALSSTLASATAAYLATHLASKAAAFEKFVSKDTKQHHHPQPRDNEMYQRNALPDSVDPNHQTYDQSFRLSKASEALEHVAEDAICQWVPLQKFGIEANDYFISPPDESAGAFDPATHHALTKYDNDVVSFG